MCGIAGYFGFADGKALLTTMNRAQAHRGPDGDGFFTDTNVGLAHLRLAIIDRDHGQQPITDSSQNYTIVYNGEIYNYKELRAELQQKGRVFKTNSDTEVVLEGYAEWGAECFDKLNGMFALAIWDKAKQQLVLARDHFGIKPLYFGNAGDLNKPQIVFASEIKAILASQKITSAPNDRLIYRYLAFRAHEDTPETFFSGIEKLMPGEMVVIDKKGLARSNYTELREQLAVLATRNSPYMPSQTDEYRRRLTESIKMRLMSEVPVGTCLSGGLDSSTIALIVNQLLAKKDQAAGSVGAQQNTFSAVFPGSINDEEKYIDAVLDKAKGKVASHKVYPTADSFAADLEDFIRTQEEPTISTGPYAQYKVMEEASKHVTVLLDGQGADEMLAGYYPYYFVYLRQLKREGKWLKLATEMLRSADVLFRFLRFRIYDTLQFRRRVGIRQLLGADFKAAHIKESFTSIPDNLKKRFIQDLFYNSIPALLRYEDKNTMRFGLEGRVPFLDKEVTKFLFGLSDEAIIRGSWNKRILRDATKGLLPEMVRTRRNKIGFTTPEQEWFKRLKTRFYGVFLSESFANRPYFNQQEVLAAFEGHIKGRNTTDTMVFWRMLNVELWLREFFDQKEKTKQKAEKPDLEPNQEKSLDITANGADFRRYPLRTKMVAATDDLAPFVTDRLKEFFTTLSAAKNHKQYTEKPWQLFISEKIVAITQGRSYFIWDIKPSFWARTLSKFVVKTPYGIGLGSPWTMQLAIEEAGLARILFASVAAAVGKVFGKKGLFYELAGADVRAIDGPTEYSVYPSNVSAKLPPKDPAKVAQQLDNAIRSALPKKLLDNFKGVVVIDANDLGRNVLGHNTSQKEAHLEAIFADNPLGQGSERTPLCVVFEK
ncbi:MAG TPA: asparagine synthase (glutamine-hydrolyzing) [Candidatus Saccharimonadales bacterium]|nr:asparagine synthase (glutamine-hydrolyzing) [Candidatus Saccharimonadales bacterium]